MLTLNVNQLWHLGYAFISLGTEVREDVRSSGQRLRKRSRGQVTPEGQGTLWRRMRSLKVGAEQSGRHPGSTWAKKRSQEV